MRDAATPTPPGRPHSWTDGSQSGRADRRSSQRAIASRSHTTLIGAVLGFALVSGTIGPQFTSATENTPAPEFVALDDTLLVSPISEPATPVLVAEAALNGHIGDNADVYGGYKISDDGNRLILNVATHNEAKLEEAQKLAGASWEVVELYQVDNSWQHLRETRDALAAVRYERSSLNLVGLNSQMNTLTVLVDPGDIKNADAKQLSEQLAPVEMQVLRDAGLDRVVMGVETGASAVDSRNADSNWKSGGSGYNYTDFDTGEARACSYGLPVDISGWGRSGLTAGHCRAGDDTLYAPDRKLQYLYSFGSRETTSWPGNADVYGDFTVLGGAPGYSTTIWARDTVLTAIKDAYWYSRGSSSQLCSSGRSGWYCRYYITATESTVWLNFPPFLTKVYPVTVMKHRSNNVDNDCSGWQGGDSGGAVYFSHWSGSGVIVQGLISASSYLCDNRNYYASELWGVGRWGDVAGKRIGIPLYSGSTDWWN